MHQSSVFLLVLVCVNQDIVHVYCDLSFPKFLGKDGIHYGLESGRGVGKAEKHHSWFK